MTCLICKSGVTAPGCATVTLERGSRVVVIKDVPADVCDNCGEYYLSDDISAVVLEQADRAIRGGSDVQVLQFAA